MFQRTVGYAKEWTNGHNVMLATEKPVRVRRDNYDLLLPPGHPKKSTYYANRKHLGPCTSVPMVRIRGQPVCQRHRIARQSQC